MILLWYCICISAWLALLSVEKKICKKNILPASAKRKDSIPLTGFA